MLGALSVLGRHARRNGVLERPRAPGRGPRRPRRTVLRAMSRPFPIRSRPGPARWPLRARKGPCSSRAPSIFLPSSVAAATTHSVGEKLSVFALATFVLVADRRRRVRRRLFDRQNPSCDREHFRQHARLLQLRHVARDPEPADLLRRSSSGSRSVYWIYKDARRRIEDPWLVGVATLLGVVVPFFGPFIYMLFRPPEYLDDVRERELEIKAMEDRLVEARPPLPGLPHRGRLELPRLPDLHDEAQAGVRDCKQPLEALWQVCPYCETPVEPPAGDAAALGTRRAAARGVDTCRSDGVERTLILIKPDAVRRGSPARSSAASRRAASRSPAASCSR